MKTFDDLKVGELFRFVNDLPNIVNKKINKDAYVPS